MRISYLIATIVLVAAAVSAAYAAEGHRRGAPSPPAAVEPAADVKAERSATPKSANEMLRAMETMTAQDHANCCGKTGERRGHAHEQ